MTQQWTARVWITGAGLVFTTDSAAAGDYGLADPLTISYSLPDSDTTPMVQPNPASATFRFVAPSASYWDVQLGQPVTIRVWDHLTPAAADKPKVSFAGRVANVKASPHALGALVTVDCVDYLADLAEPQVGTGAYPSETLDARVRRILTEAGYTPAAGLGLYDADELPNDVTIGARSAGAAGALELLTHTLSQYRLSFPSFPASTGLATLRPDVTPAPDVATWADGAASLAGFKVHNTVRSLSWAAPLRVTLAAGVYSLTGSAADSNGTGLGVSLDGGHVEMGVEWTQRKGQGVNRVDVAWQGGTATARWSGHQPIVAQVETELTSSADAGQLAGLYLPPVDPSDVMLWTVDALTWRLDREAGTSWVLPYLGRNCTVVDIQTSWQPADREWYAGVCAGWTYQLTKGQPIVQLQLVPWNVDPAMAANPVKFSDLAAGQTFGTTNARDTFTDYQLAGV